VGARRGGLKQQNGRAREKKKEGGKKTGKKNIGGKKGIDETFAFGARNKQQGGGKKGKRWEWRKGGR